MKDIKDFFLGQKAKVKAIISEDDIDSFVRLSGDDNKLHVDHEFARLTEFKKPVAHGMISASFISTLIGTKLPGDGALWYKQSIDFVNPVYVGDSIIVEGEVVKIIPSTRTLVLKTTVHKEEGTVVIKGEAHVKILEADKTSKGFQYTTNGARTILVLGSTGAVGSKVCELLAEEGYDLILHYNSNKKKADLLKQKLSKYKVKIYSYKASFNAKNDVIELADDIKIRFDQYLYGICFAISPRIQSGSFHTFKREDLMKSFTTETLGLMDLTVQKNKGDDYTINQALY